VKVIGSRSYHGREINNANDNKALYSDEVQNHKHNQCVCEKC